MFSVLNDNLVRASLVVSFLAMPGLATATENVEERLSALEAQMVELNEKLDMLIESTQKSTVYSRQSGTTRVETRVEPESFIQGYFKRMQDECH